MGLQKGVYGVRLTATNQNGQFTTDTVWIAVDTTISITGMQRHVAPLQAREYLHLEFIFQNELLPIGEAVVMQNKGMCRNPIHC